MAIKIVSRLKAAFDAYQDPLTGRGGSNDRTQRLQGGANVWGDQDLYDRYSSNGFMQRVIEAPADDSTRAGFELETKKQETNLYVQTRLKELGAKHVMREVVKHAGIYPKGCAAFIGVIAENLDDQINYWKPMPENIRRVDYINLLSEPGEFTVNVRRALHPTAKNYKEIYFTVQGVEVHQSRMIWVSNEFNTRTSMGISRVNTVWDAISAQDSALWSVSHLMQVLSMLVFKSDEFVTLPKEKQAAVLKKIREWIDTSSMMGVAKDEELGRVNVQLSGLGDILDFIFKSIAGATQMPVNILLGRVQGVLTSAEEDSINYYNSISEFQQDKLEPEWRKLIDLVVRERQGPAYSSMGGKLIYNIKFNTLWELSPSLKSEIEKRNSERDVLDTQSGKVKTPEELRGRDPYFSVLDQSQPAEDGDDESDDTDKPDDETQQQDGRGSMVVDGKRVGAGRIAFDRVNLGGEWQRLQVRRPGLFKAKGFRIDSRREGEGVLVITGLMDSTDQLATQAVLFGKGWSAEAQKAWADKHLPGVRRVVDYSADKLSILEVDRLMIQADPVETTENEIRIRLKSPRLFDQDHGFKSQKVAGAKGVRAIVGRLKGKTAASWQSLRFDREQWTAGEAQRWVKKHKITGDNYLPEPRATEIKLLPWAEFEDEPMMRHEELDLDKGVIALQGVLRDNGEVGFQSIRFTGDQWDNVKAESWLATELSKVPAQFAKLEASRRIAKKRGNRDE